MNLGVNSVVATVVTLGLLVVTVLLVVVVGFLVVVNAVTGVGNGNGVVLNAVFLGF